MSDAARVYAILNDNVRRAKRYGMFNGRIPVAFVEHGDGTATAAYIK